MLANVVGIVASVVVAYLVGGVPWSLIVGKRFFGIDLRQRGSGNLGATNVFRELGARAGVGVLLLDVGKGALAVLLAMLLVPHAVTGNARDWVLVGVGITAVLGHTFSPYIRFRGGKGVATAAGVIAVMLPLDLPALIITFVAVIALWRMVSLGSVVIAVEFPLLTTLLYGQRPALVAFSAVAAVLVIVKHRSNIARIIRREESHISFSGRGASVSPPEGKE